jgi:hypothetical protein
MYSTIVCVFTIGTAWAKDPDIDAHGEKDASATEIFFNEEASHLSGSGTSIDPSQISRTDEDLSIRVMEIPPANISIRASDQDYHPNSTFGTVYTKNGGWRRDCLCDRTGPCSTRYRGDSIITFAFDIEEEGYDVRFWMRHYGFDYYAPDDTRGDPLWQRFENAHQEYRVLTTEWIGNHQNTGEIKFRNGNNDTPRGGTLHGTIGYELRKDGRIHSRWLIEPSMGGRGREWKHCGHRFTITLGSP